MRPASKTSITVREAEEGDVGALTTIKGIGSEAVHRDRLRDAERGGFRSLVLVAEEVVIGFACLVQRRPASWSDADDEDHLPQIVDLQVAEMHRGRGYGTAFVRAIEHIAAEAGSHELYLAVEPEHNPRAFALYRRLGYRPLQAAPYRKGWAFVDSAGRQHGGEDWLVDMVKPLAGASD